MHVCVHASHVRLPMKARKGTESPKTGIIGIYKLPDRCWGKNSVSLQEQQGFLTSERSLQILLTKTTSINIYLVKVNHSITKCVHEQEIYILQILRII